MIEVIYPNPVMEFGTVVLATLPNDVAMWQTDNKVRPMVVTLADKDFTVAVPLSTAEQHERVEMEIEPNLCNNLRKPSAVVHQHRILFSADILLRKVGQLTPAEQVRLRKILFSKSMAETHMA